jgi:inner membrane protein
MRKVRHMDPVSQGALGAALAQSLADRQKIASAAWFGALAGMAPDLDVFIRSSTDPLLFLEYHRQFTHSLIFIPVGALIVTAALYRVIRHQLSFREAYLASTAGYATHGLLDACTTYGTLLLWPFSDIRIAWNNVSVVDPLFTIPLLIFVVLAWRRRKPSLAAAGMIWAVFYLAIGVVQHQRAMDAAAELAANRNHTPHRLSIKPGFANLLLWKSVYEHNNVYYVDGIRAGTPVMVCEGDQIEKLNLARHLPHLDPSSQQATDIQRFRWFSSDFLAWDPKRGSIVDIRYSLVPNQIDALWGIRLNAAADPTAHVSWWAERSAGPEVRSALYDLVSGAACTTP